MKVNAPAAERAPLPAIVRWAIVVTFFNTWVLFEETIIDRYGWWEYLPYYRYGKLCAWDIGALALITWLVWRGVGRRVRRPATEETGG